MPFFFRLCLKVLYPILMITAVWRIVKLRVHPDAVLVFNCYDRESDPDAANDSPGLLSKMKTSLLNDHSLFAWADTGEWKTAGNEGSQTFRESDWFRIGFEPIFVDFTKSGTWYIVVSLAQVGVQYTTRKIDV